MTTAERPDKPPGMILLSLPVIAAGGLAVAAVLTGGLGGETPGHKDTSASFAVGVGCASPPGNISQRREGNKITVQCVNPDGSPGTVTALGRLFTNHPGQLNDYDATIEVSATKPASDAVATLTFAFDGLAGVVTFEPRIDINPDHGDTDQINEIARAID
jgi:hypothetical protein